MNSAGQPVEADLYRHSSRMALQAPEQHSDPMVHAEATSPQQTPMKVSTVSRSGQSAPSQHFWPAQQGKTTLPLPKEKEAQEPLLSTQHCPALQTPS